MIINTSYNFFLNRSVKSCICMSMWVVASWSMNHVYIHFRICTVYPKNYVHGFCFAVLCCGYTLTDFPISIRLTSLALWQSNDCPSASKVTLMNMDKYFMWIHYERLHNHNKAKHNKTVCIFLGIYCMYIYIYIYIYIQKWISTWFILHNIIEWPMPLGARLRSIKMRTKYCNEIYVNSKWHS